jgi:hypothetical protein
MPTLSTPTLTLGDTVSNKRDVTVAGTITFDAGDVGKTYRLEIKLFGDDSASDNRPAADSAADDLIYTYQWTPPFLFLPRPFKAITVTAAGNVSYSEKRAVASAALDEDSGVVSNMVGGVLIQMPRSDEVYAAVTIAGAPVTANTATVTAGIGV